jgi:hypothetical protein
MLLANASPFWILVRRGFSSCSFFLLENSSELGGSVIVGRKGYSCYYGMSTSFGLNTWVIRCLQILKEGSVTCGA